MFPDVHIKKILFATDLSEYARKAFAYAVNLADHFGAGITMLHVVMDGLDDFPMARSYVGRENLEKIRDEHLQEARQAMIGKSREFAPQRKAMTRICEEAKEKIDTMTFTADEIVVVTGDPAEEIVRQSVERNCDIIVMGSHGHGGIMDAWLGSVSLVVLKRSKKPVFMVRLDEPAR
ncbi:MAG: universal stress protein [Thermodesulfobacteriota bacterium]